MQAERQVPWLELVLQVFQGVGVGSNLWGPARPMPCRETTWWGSIVVCCVRRSSALRVASNITSSRPMQRWDGLSALLGLGGSAGCGGVGG